MTICNDPVATNYIEMLEKVNNQLSLAYAPLGLAVGILSAFLAVLAIVFAAILWKQSQDSRTQWNDFIKKMREDGEKAMEEVKNNMDKTIAEAEKNLETATGDTKEKYRQELESFKRARAQVPLTPYISSLTIPSATGFSSIYGANNTMFANTQVPFLQAASAWPYGNMTAVDSQVLTPGGSSDDFGSRITELESEIEKLKEK